MSTYSHLCDRLEGASEEQGRRRAHLFALLLVAVVATAKHVSGLTESSASFTVYGLAIAVSALVGGFWPACVATMAAVLLANVDAQSAVGPASRIVFALEGLGVALLIGAITRRRREADARLEATQAANDELRAEQRRGAFTHSALQHLEDIAPDAAVFVVNAQGHIVEWPCSAERMYGYSADQIVGSSLTAIFSDAAAPIDFRDLLTGNTDPGVRRPGVHRRSDGTRLDVEFEVKPCRSVAAEHFTVAAQDLSGRRETEAFRETALRDQVALQKVADEAQGQVAALESLTDPSVNPIAGLTMLGELLERLRSTMRADGVAVVQVGRTGTRVISGAGLRPDQVRAPGAAASSGAADGRVALVHNDAASVAQISALRWPSTVSSIMVVPVSHTGPAGVRIEVVKQRQASATEWDLALARIVADRLAPVIDLQLPADSGNAVA